jgi:hypothetical protein
VSFVDRQEVSARIQQEKQVEMRRMRDSFQHRDVDSNSSPRQQKSAHQVKLLKECEVLTSSIYCHHFMEK